MAVPSSKVNTRLQRCIQALLTDRPVAYHPVLARAVKSATAGILLSQFLYWTPRTRDTDGWIYKTQKDIYEETALTRWEQETARKILKGAGVLEEKRAGSPSRLFFRVNMAGLVERLSADDEEKPHRQDVGKPHSRMLENHIVESGKASDKNVGNQPAFYITENTTEITAENNIDRFQEIWNQVLLRLQETVVASEYNKYLAGTRLVRLDDRVAVIAAAGDSFVTVWLERRMYQNISKPLRDILGYQVDLRFQALDKRL